jgi:membrane protein implicated in regulation of membrane protease activity
MDMNPATVWWLIAGGLVAIELATGTFYLLMLAIGAAGAALAGHLGLGLTAQIVTAAILGGAAVVLWHQKRAGRTQSAPAHANSDVNLDIGQSVQVTQWGPDGRATVKYRGAEWQVRYLGRDTPGVGRYVIRAIEGSCLLLDH